MNLTVPTAISLVKAVQVAAERNPAVDVAVFPSFVSLGRVAEVASGSAVSVGAQDVFWKESGAYTGEISASMLLDAGCKYCIVGHSERRGRFGVADDTPAGYFSETNATVSRKIAALLYAGIAPILCVGETAAERNEGLTSELIETQLLESLANVEVTDLIVAYEPVWAIGTGAVCEPDEAEKQCAFIREVCEIDGLRVLYGGSVKSENAGPLFAMPSIDGALVGGASINADEFAKIIKVK